MFIGEYHYSLDLKRRLAIPVKFRKVFKGKAVITKGLDGCLFVYPLSVWEKMAEKLGKFPLGERRTRQFVRFILAGAIKSDIDKQGRILVPQYLGKFAHLKKEVVLVGLYDRLELWDKGRWEKSIARAEKDKDKTAEELGKSGIY
jgi:MraZ protein